MRESASPRDAGTSDAQQAAVCKESLLPAPRETDTRGRAVEAAHRIVAKFSDAHARGVSPEPNDDAFRVACSLLVMCREAVMQGWQPIETAPKSETEHIIVGGPGYAYEAFWEDGDWFTMDVCGALVELVNEPTHWMPLPTPPSPAPSSTERGEAPPITDRR